MSKHKLCMISSAFYYRVETKKKTKKSWTLVSHGGLFLPFKFVLEAIREEHKIISGLMFTPSNFFVNLLSVLNLDKAVDCSNLT